jgi:hypothetical protein
MAIMQLLNLPATFIRQKSGINFQIFKLTHFQITPYHFSPLALYNF